jgi:hypothetical protein
MEINVLSCASVLSSQYAPEGEMRVALYGRVSTTNHGQDVGVQLTELRDYCARRRFEITGEYVDHGISGAKDSRPALNRLMADAHKRNFDAVCCWKLDRFGRSLKHLVNAIADLESLGVAFISLQDNLDLSTPSGRLMFHIIAAMKVWLRSGPHSVSARPRFAGGCKGLLNSYPVFPNPWEHPRNMVKTPPEQGWEQGQELT